MRKTGNWKIEMGDNFFLLIFEKLIVLLFNGNKIHNMRLCLKKITINVLFYLKHLFICN